MDDLTWMLVGYDPEDPNASAVVEAHPLGPIRGTAMIGFVVVLDRRLDLMRYAAMPTDDRGSLVSGLLPQAAIRVGRTMYDEQARVLVARHTDARYAQDVQTADLTDPATPVQP